MDAFRQDIRYAARMLLKSPGFTAVALCSLALGVGANSAIFAIIKAVFLQPLPVMEPSRLVGVWTSAPGGTYPLSRPNLLDYGERNAVFTGMAAMSPASVALARPEGSEAVYAQLVTGNFFALLGVKPLLGRVFGEAEDSAPGKHPVIVLSHGVWTRLFGSDPALIGAKVTLNGEPFTILGVMPPGFQGFDLLGAPMIWIPGAMYQRTLPRPEWYNERRANFWYSIARLKPGVSIGQAEAAMKTIAAQLAREYPGPNEGQSVKLAPMAQSTINPVLRPQLARAGILMATVAGLVLLIACANLANLLLVRAGGRRKEIAIRVALGAEPGRVARLLMTESLLLAFAGGVLGLAVARWARDVLWSFRPPLIWSSGLALPFDWGVLAFNFALTLVTGLLFGLAPMLRARRPELATDLKERAPAASGREHTWNLRSVLLSGQVAFSVIALTGVGLFLRSLINAQRLDPGFDARNLGMLRLNAGAQGLGTSEGLEFYRRAVEQAMATPGVRAASLSQVNLMAGGGYGRDVFAEGSEPSNRIRSVLFDVVTPRYFETTRVNLVRGRDFAEFDREGSLPVAIVNETMARRLWPNGSAVGKRLQFVGDGFYREVVGVARDNKFFTLGESPMPCVYAPLAQNYLPAMTLYASIAGEPAAIGGQVRAQLQTVYRHATLGAVDTIGAAMRRSLWAPRMTVSLLAVFGALGLALAAIGIYGVTAYAASQRLSEIGIRMALGARAADVIGMFLRQGLALLLPGLILGVAAAIALARVTSSLLFGVAAFDPPAYAGACLMLALVASAAIFFAARRAAKGDPMLGLRQG